MAYWRGLERGRGTGAGYVMDRGTFLYLLSTPYSSFVSFSLYFTFFYSFLPWGWHLDSWTWTLDIGHGTGESGGFFITFLLRFFGMVFVSFIFFLLSDLVFNSGVFFVMRGSSLV